MITLKNRNEVRARVAVAAEPLKVGMKVYFPMDEAIDGLPAVRMYGMQFHSSVPIPLRPIAPRIGIVLHIPNDNTVTDFEIETLDAPYTSGAATRGTFDIDAGTRVLVVMGAPVIGYPKALWDADLAAMAPHYSLIGTTYGPNTAVAFDLVTGLPVKRVHLSATPGSTRTTSDGQIQGVEGGEIIIDCRGIN
jgi:hypothetical protein